MDVGAGTLVTENVRLKRPLGQGAMGTVWVADHLTLKTEVAVKLIAPELGRDKADILARFVQEASLAAKIKSPHVVQVFDQGVMGGDTPYIVMELLDGESLQDRLNRQRRLPIREVARIVTHVARALSKAHELDVVHRDIKPDNIFLTPADDGPFCKVLDFGIAKQTQLPGLGGITNPGAMVGTPEYMSPEQVLSAKDVDARADLWGLAVTAYHGLTGELPFTAEALGTLCVKLLDGRFKAPSEIWPDLSADIDRWMAKALAREPADRFASAKQLAATFAAIADGSAIDETVLQPLPPPSAATRTAPATVAASSTVGSLPGAVASLHGATTRPRRWGAASWIGVAVGVAALATVAVVVTRSPSPDPSPADPSPAAQSEAPSEVADSDDEPEQAEPEQAEPEPAEPQEPEPEPASSASAIPSAQPAVPQPQPLDGKAVPGQDPPSPAARPVPPAPKPPAPPPTPAKKHYDHGF